MLSQDALSLLLVVKACMRCSRKTNGEMQSTTMQAFMLRIFTSGADGELVDRLRHLLRLLSVLVLFEGCQIVLSGIVEVSCRAKAAADQMTWCHRPPSMHGASSMRQVACLDDTGADSLA